MADVAYFNYIMCPLYDRNQDSFPLLPCTNPPRLNRCIENGFMNLKNSRGETTLTWVALIRAAIGYCRIFVNTVSQIASWSPKAKELMKRGEEIIAILRQGWDSEGGGQGVKSLMPTASPYELVIKIMIEEQIGRETRPRNQLSEFTLVYLGRGSWTYAEAKEDERWPQNKGRKAYFILRCAPDPVPPESTLHVPP